nr:immunoglobulin heavy chain junction region [Macaca mulatta]MOV48814.1 immunoglobulin heavy chain junction region [Macaca mulatta]MOV48824.1 immunoglobulin heavy chain junction region [Macaca mulatta]MOV48877.1 immunoglobulin heavy chain junction region [Macaca mulatta]MOV49247.1 immunoglobulin heavy chain junction region [Macaca mulatta]
CARKQANFDYW